MFFIKRSLCCYFYEPCCTSYLVQTEWQKRLHTIHRGQHLPYRHQ